jgi:hypothetical protein
MAKVPYVRHYVEVTNTLGELHFKCLCGVVIYHGHVEKDALKAEAAHIQKALNPLYADRDEDWRATFPDRLNGPGKNTGFWEGVIAGLVIFLLRER